MSEEALYADPNADDVEVGGFGDSMFHNLESEGSGRIVVPIAFEKVTAKSGTVILKIRLTCIACEDNPSEVGRDTEGKFFLTKKAIKQFARFVKACRYTDPINVLDDDDLDTFIARAQPCSATIKRDKDYVNKAGQHRQGRLMAAFFDYAEEGIDPDSYSELVDQAAGRWDRYCSWQEDRNSGGSSSSYSDADVDDDIGF